MKPLAIDLFCGLGGWTDGLLAEGWDVIGFDIEAHQYGEERYPAQLVVQDVLTIHGKQFAIADLIVASPPCQEFSYMAMPWGRAKQIGLALRGKGEFPDGYRGSRTVEELRALFDACFRIQSEASQAAGRHVPMVVENVKGAQPWVGRAPWSFGSYFLWGDIPALMPIQKYHARLKVKAGEQWNVNRANFTGTRGWDVAPDEGFNTKGMDWSDRAKRGQDFTRIGGHQALIAEGHKHRDQDGYERNHPNAFGWKAPRTTSQGAARKAASAKIAKIPFALSSHIARVYYPRRSAAA